MQSGLSQVEDVERHIGKSSAIVGDESFHVRSPQQLREVASLQRSVRDVHHAPALHGEQDVVQCRADDRRVRDQGLHRSITGIGVQHPVRLDQRALPLADAALQRIPCGRAEVPCVQSEIGQDAPQRLVHFVPRAGRSRQRVRGSCRSARRGNEGTRDCADDERQRGYSTADACTSLPCKPPKRARAMGRNMLAIVTWPAFAELWNELPPALASASASEAAPQTIKACGGIGRLRLRRADGRSLVPVVPRFGRPNLTHL